MSDLVKKARSYGGCSEATHEVSELVHALADRIEQLERELADTAEAHMLELEWRLKLGRDMQELRAKLAAERALADWLGKSADNVEYMERPHSLDDALRAYRKARGL